MNVPSDLSEYYPTKYYSFNLSHDESPKKMDLEAAAVRSVIDHRLGKRTLLGAPLAKYTKKFLWIRNGMFDRNTRILDVGCGNGALLQLLAKAGFKYLRGADAFIREDIRYESGVTIEKRTINELTGSFGFIMLNHTFEHLPDPLQAMKAISERLENGGKLMIRIPVADCYAWRNYGIDWVQLDAPRHLFLHTEKSMDELAKNVGLKLEHVEYDSTDFQFIGSEKYKRGLLLNAKEDLDFSKVAEYRALADKLNNEKDGDTASFYFEKIQTTLSA